MLVMCTPKPVFGAPTVLLVDDVLVDDVPEPEDELPLPLVGITAQVGPVIVLESSVTVPAA